MVQCVYFPVWIFPKIELQLVENLFMVATHYPYLIYKVSALILFNKCSIPKEFISIFASGYIYPYASTWFNISQGKHYVFPWLMLCFFAAIIARLSPIALNRLPRILMSSTFKSPAIKIANDEASKTTSVPELQFINKLTPVHTMWIPYNLRINFAIGAIFISLFCYINYN